MCSRSYCAGEDEHVARERGYVEELGLRVWRKANSIKEGGAFSFDSFCC